MPIFKATIDQIRAAPHLSLLIRGGIVWREIDDSEETDECSFYDDWLPRHNGIVLRAKTLDEQLVREVQCGKCIQKYGPCNADDCFFKKMGTDSREILQKTVEQESAG